MRLSGTNILGLIAFFITTNVMAQVKIIAHRGASGNAPENTLPAFKMAIDQKADFIELDIHLSKDNEIIVMHDESVNRTTNGKGKIRNLTLDQIKNLDAGKWFDKSFTGLTVPLLEEVFGIADEKINFLIEIKGSPRKYPGIEKLLIDKIRSHGLKKRCIIQSFDLAFLEKLNSLDADLNLHYLIVGKIFPGNFPAFIRAVNINHLFVSRRKIDKIHGENRKIFVWTVNDEDRMKKLLTSGVDGIITNYPGLLKTLLLEK